MHKGSGAVVAETEFKLSEATKGLTNLDLRELELKDMEVARKLQEEEIKVSKEGRKVLHFVGVFMLKKSEQFYARLKSNQTTDKANSIMC